jgi:protein-disulfide isomerase
MSKQGRNRAEEIRRMKAQQAAAERRRRSLFIGGAVLVLIGIVVAVAIGIQSGRSDETSGSAPEGATSDFGVPRGEPDAPVNVVVYEDFQCPACKAVEELVGSTLTTYVDDGTANVEYRPIAFLDDMSSTDYSTRASVTAACTLDSSGPETWLALHDLLFAEQPAEQTAGLSDDQLADLASEAGADRDAVSDCQEAGTFEGWVAAATEQASKDNVTKTPTYFVDGEEVTFSDAEDPTVTLSRLIDDAAAASS